MKMSIVEEHINNIKDTYFRIELLLGYLHETYDELMENYRPAVDDKRSYLPVNEIKALDKSFKRFYDEVEEFVNKYEFKWFE